MKKIATITFHGAHNFGSSLQTYALQTFTENLFKENGEECDYKVINFRTDFQKQMYSYLPKPKGVRNAIKFLMRLPYLKKYKRKWNKFEDFINNTLNTGEEINTLEQINQVYGDNDVYISGSDQIWNVRSRDFNEAYYLTSLKGKKKISYSASFGPLAIDWSKYDKQKFTDALNDYSAISVREEGSFQNAKTLTEKEVDIHVDSTLLLSKEEWIEFGSGKNYKNGEYILMYCLEPSKEQLKMAKRISKFLKLPIVVTRYNNKNDYFNSFKKLYDTGPKDFISLINNAKFVITSSFHGTAFSIILQKPFFALDGATDRRISNVLALTNLNDRAVNSNNLEEKLLKAYNLSFEDSFAEIEKERQKAKEYLWNNLY